MKLSSSITGRLKAISKAITRFPVTFLILIAIAVLNGISIESSRNFEKEIIVLVFACFSFLTVTVLAERIKPHFLTMGICYLAAIAASITDWLLVMPLDAVNRVVEVNTMIAVFALTLAFLWIPSYHNRADFNSVFLSVFKSVFISAFFSAIIWGGISLILAAIDALLFRIDGNAYSHTANFIWIIWAPMLFLSLLPVFGDDRDQKKFERAASYPKFLEILLSYVLAPLAAIYTIVLLIYIVKTVTLGSWNDNLLEPLTLSYCVAVLLLYILLSRLENRFAALFRMIFPKVLIPIAIFQTISTSMKVFNEGVIFSRYLILMTGVFSIVCGVLLCIIPVRKNGLIAILAVLFALVSITPGVGAFSVSFQNQYARVRNTLIKNSMLVQDQIIPNADIPNADRDTISSAVEYLYTTGETVKVPFLPDGFNVYNDFESTFGFPWNETAYPDISESKYLSLSSQEPIELSGYTFMISAYISIPGETSREELCRITEDGKTYDIALISEKEDSFITVLDSNKTELLSVSMNRLFDELKTVVTGNQKGEVGAEQMTFDVENVAARLRIVFRNASIYYSQGEQYRNGEVIILFAIP